MSSRRSADLPEVVPNSYYPEVAPSETTQNVSTLPEAVVDAPKYDTVVGGNNGQDVGESYKEYSPPAVAAGTGTGTGTGNERRIWGLKRKTFFILLAVVLLVIIGAAVGGGVGATAGKDKSSDSSSGSDSDSDSGSGSSSGDDGDDSSDDVDPLSISPASHLTSVNYTDSDGNDHYYVFFQDRSANIIGSFWDSENKTWEARNITGNIRSSSIDLDVNVGDGFSAVAWSDSDNEWNMKLYVLSTPEIITELDASENSKDTSWSLSQNNADLGSGSNLAAFRPNGGNSSWPPICLLGQDNQRISYTNLDGDWVQLQTGTSSNGVTAVNGTGVAITTRCSYCGEASMEWKFYVNDGSTMHEYSVSGDLSNFNADNALDDISSSIPKTNYAAINFEESDLFVVNINDDGSLEARWWNTEVWSDASAPTLKGSPSGISASSNFTAVAMNSDRRVYGIVDGSIYEWQFDNTDPLEWVYKGAVNSTVPN